MRSLQTSLAGKPIWSVWNFCVQLPVRQMSLTGECSIRKKHWFCLVDQMVLRHADSPSHAWVYSAVFVCRISPCAFQVSVSGFSLSHLSTECGRELFPANRCHHVASGVLPRGWTVRGGWFVLDLQLVRSELLSEDTLSLVATDSRDSGVVHLGYNLVCLWNQVSSVGSHSLHVKQVMQGKQREKTLHDTRVNVNFPYPVISVVWRALK